MVLCFLFFFFWLWVTRGSHRRAGCKPLGVAARKWCEEGSGAGSPWLGPAFWSHRSSQSCGVAILFSSRVPFQSLQRVQMSLGPTATGRILRVDFSLRQANYTVVSVYAPCVGSERSAFFTVLQNSMAKIQHRTVLMGGDFNCISDPILDQVLAPSSCRLHGASASGLEQSVDRRPAHGDSEGGNVTDVSPPTNGCCGSRARPRHPGPATIPTDSGLAYVAPSTDEESHAPGARVVDNGSTRAARSRTGRLDGSAALADVMETAGLVDSWRERHENQAGFTHIATAMDSAARLDRWYTTRNDTATVVDDAFVDNLVGDHRGVSITLCPSDGTLQGRGQWRLPPSYLADTVFCDRLGHNLRTFAEQHPLLPASSDALADALAAYPPPSTATPAPQGSEGSPPTATAAAQPLPQWGRPNCEPLDARDRLDGLLRVVATTALQHARNVKLSAFGRLAGLQHRLRETGLGLEGETVSVSKPPKGDYLTFLIRDVAYKDTVGKVLTSPIEWSPPHIQLFRWISSYGEEKMLKNGYGS